MQEKRAAVLGAGVSGLATAHYLKKNGFEVSVYEKYDRPGGQLHSTREKDYLLDKGTLAAIETTNLIPSLVEELKLGEQFVYAGEKANLKQAYIGGKLYELSMNPENLFKFPLFTFRSRLRFFIEPFIPRSRKDGRLAVAEFIRRRLGEEFLNYIIEPFASEVYAGDPEKLSIEAAYPKLFRLEQEYGSIVKGFKKAPLSSEKKDEYTGSGKLFSFKGGMDQLTAALSKSLGYRVNYLHDIVRIEPGESGGYSLVINRKGDIRKENFDVVVSALPAYILAESIRPVSDSLAGMLNRVEYVPLTQVYISYLKQDLELSPKGYTVLIPAIEKNEVLNITIVSELFPERCPEDRVLFSVMMGGSRNPGLAEDDPTGVKKKAISTVSEIFKSKDKPVFVSHKSWRKGVPQYNTGHYDILETIREFEASHKGFFVTGNYVGGVSVGDSILSSFKTAERAARLFPKK